MTESAGHPGSGSVINGVAVPALSIYPRCVNGPFSKADRFFDPAVINDTPGPAYQIPSVFEEHIQSPIYKGVYENPKLSGEIKDEQGNPIKTPTPPNPFNNGLPHPSKDRTAWMIGITKNDLAYYSSIASQVGPAFYSPNSPAVQSAAPRNVFSKNPRFSSLTHRYISREHDKANLCTASPGPRYLPKLGHIDLNTPRPPIYSFGGKNSIHRSSFLNAQVKDGYLYTARPATSDPLINISPASYSPDGSTVLTSPPQPVWSRGDRFADSNFRFISKGHTRSKIGLNSPGPAYYPHNNEISDILRKKNANTGGGGAKGKWCP